MIEHHHGYLKDNVAATLHAEIGYFEHRLNEIGHGGDCAYEHALVKFYISQIEQKRLHLQRL